MRRIAFIITIVGIFTLISILTFQTPLQVSSLEEMDRLENNKNIILTGRVISQTQSTITLSNNILIQCFNCPLYLNKEIGIKAVIQKYNNRVYVKALKIYER